MRAPDAEADDRHRAGTDAPHSGASLVARGPIPRVEPAAGLDVAVQRLLLGPMAPAGASSRRMEPNAALAFVFFGAALVVARSARRDRIYNVGFGVLAGGVEVLGVFALLGHAFGLDAAYGWGRLMSMAPQTAVSISVLGLGPTAMAWRKAAADRAQDGPGIAITALAGLLGSILLAGMMLGD